MSQLNCLFFAELRETLQCGQLSLQHIEGESVAEFIERLIAQEGERFHALKEDRVKVAINSELSHVGGIIPTNAEVAFFPPVTGG